MLPIALLNDADWARSSAPSGRGRLRFSVFGYALSHALIGDPNYIGHPRQLSRPESGRLTRSKTDLSQKAEASKGLPSAFLFNLSC
jgi:hypothetical protein